MPDNNSGNSFPAWGLPILTAIGAFIIGILLERFKSRLVLLKYNTTFFPLATATNHSFWGNIQVLYNNRQTNHLSITTVDIVNDSNTDLEKVKVNFWVDENSQLLSHNGFYVETGNAIELEDGYFKTLHEVTMRNESDMVEQARNPKHVTPQGLVNDRKWVLTNKIFALPVFNRKTTVRFNLLIENFKGEVPQLTVSILHKSCKLVKHHDEVQAKARKDKLVGWLWLFLYSLTVTYIYINYSTNPNAVIWCAVMAVVDIFLTLLLVKLITNIKRIWQ